MIDIKEDQQVRCRTFFDQETGSRVIVISKVGANLNELLVQHTNQLLKFKRGKVYGSFKDTIWLADLTEIRSLFSFNCVVKQFLYMVDASDR